MAQTDSGILLFDTTVTSATTAITTDKFTSDKLAQLANAETLTVLVYPVLVAGDASAQTIRVQADSVGFYTKPLFNSSPTVLFSEAADKSTYAKFIRPVKSEWDWVSSTKKVHCKYEYINSSGELATSTGTHTLNANFGWNKFTTNYRFRVDNATHYGVGTKVQVWLDLDPLWL